MTNDTICALATPAGGAIGIIRISGDKSIDIAEKVFKRMASCDAKKNVSLSKVHSHTVHYGNIVDAEGNVIDDVLITVFRAPHTYTGEESVEISCHGSRYILNTVIRLLIENGCRQALPGEYTQRAFLNGKMDLSQAEAVADLIAASNSATHKIAIGQLRGNISTELSDLRKQLLNITSLLELELDFSDHEELEFANREELLRLSKEIDKHIARLASTFASGRAIKQGIPVAIAGKTNVGKSTLLNLLCGEDKAIVSDIHGTTRDVIEDTIDINGVTFRFIDTAGLRDTSDKIEQIGIERTYRKIDEAMIVLWLFDEVPSEEEVERITSLCQGKKLVIVNNKIDKMDLTPQLSHIFPNAETIGISAKVAINTNLLRDIIYQKSDIPEIKENDVIVTSARHYDSLVRSHECISRVIDGFGFGLSGDILSEDLRLCINYLAEITGEEITTDEVLGNIFSRFCIGK